MGGGSTRIHGRRVPDGYQLVPPDGDYGWFVLGGVIITGLIIVVPTMSFGLLLKDILVTMNTTTATISWIPSLNIAMSMFFAPMSAMICESFSCRTSAFLGGLLASLGLFLSYFATRIEILFFTYGFLVGCGNGLCLNANIIVLSQYFRKYYGVMTGIALASYAFGRLVMTPIMQLVLEEYGVKGTFLIVSALLLHICVGASLYRPAARYQLLVPIVSETAAKGEDKTLLEKDTVTNGTSLKMADNRRASKENGNVAEKWMLLQQQSINGDKIAVTNCDNCSKMVQSEVRCPPAAVANNKEAVLKSAEEEYRKCIPSTLEIFGSVETMKPLKPMSEVTARSKDQGSRLTMKAFVSKLDFTILREPIFYILCIGGVTNYVTAVYSNIFLPPMAIENHLKPMQGASILSIRAGCEIIGRILSPWLLQRLKLPVRYFYIIVTLFTAANLILMISFKSFTVMACMGAVFGILFGGQTGLSMVVIVHNVGTKRLSSALGLSQFIQGFVVLMIGPGIGWIRDEYGTFRVCFYFLSGMQCILALAWALKPLAAPKKSIKETTPTSV